MFQIKDFLINENDIFKTKFNIIKINKYFNSDHFSIYKKIVESFNVFAVGNDYFYDKYNDKYDVEIGEISFVYQHSKKEKHFFKCYVKGIFFSNFYFAERINNVFFYFQDLDSNVISRWLVLNGEAVLDFYNFGKFSLLLNGDKVFIDIQRKNMPLCYKEALFKQILFTELRLKSFSLYDYQTEHRLPKKVMLENQNISFPNFNSNDSGEKFESVFYNGIDFVNPYSMPSCLDEMLTIVIGM